MRIIVDPIFVGADGRMSRGYGNGSLLSLMVLEPTKLTNSGVSEAARYESSDILTYVLGNVGKSGPQIPLIAELFSKKGISEYENVLNSSTSANINENIRGYLDKTLDLARRSPGGFLAKLKAENIEVEGTRNLERREKLKRGVDNLPAYLREPLMLENLTIMAAPKITRVEFEGPNILLQESNQATYIPGNNRIGIINDFVDNAGEKGLGLAIKEEVLHYWDVHTGTSTRLDFARAADDLIMNNERIAVIDRMSAKAMEGQI